MGVPIEQDVAERHLLPATHFVDSGSVVADLLVSALQAHQSVSSGGGIVCQEVACSYA